MVFEKTSFPWAMLSPSVHSMCGHNPELFEITRGAPIAIYSEQGSEAWNKFIRSFKSGPCARARQTSIQDNILDIFNRMMIKTHPEVASRKRQSRCTGCDKLGHTVRSCPLVVTSKKVDTLERSRVKSCFMWKNHVILLFIIMSAFYEFMWWCCILLLNNNVYT